ncbi:MAG TPA: hypothetical protein VF458_13600 [Ktedonobacteraceae bacterium]
MIGNQPTAYFEDLRLQRAPWSIERSENLEHPYVTAGNRVYSVATQHGEFTEIGWRQPSEMSGVWDHPMKLLDGFWLGVSFGHAELGREDGKTHWLTQASHWRMTPGQVEIMYRLPNLDICRREYGVDDHEGLVVCLELNNRSKKRQPVTLHFLARTDLRSAWLGEDRLIWRDGRDEAVYLDELACIAAYNTTSLAYVLFGARQRPRSVAIGSDIWATQQTKGQGISGRLSYQLDLPARSTEEVVFLIAGSTRSSEAALATYRSLQADYAVLGERQRQRYEQIFTRSALRSNDELVDTAFGWAKASLQMLERNVPGIGQGLAAGLPDYPWWFGNDTAYAALSLVATGQFELALNSLRNLVRFSQAVNDDGAMVHEILTQGHVHHNGHLVETPLFVRACYHAYRWTGDRAFLQEMYAFCKRGLLNVVLGAHDPEGQLCPTGTGLVEARELQHGEGMKTLDIAAYTYEALLCLAELAEEVGDADLVPQLREKALRLRERVNAAWWMDEEHLYGDIFISARAFAASHQALRAAEPLWSTDLADVERSSRLLASFAEQHQAQPAALEQERPWLLKNMIAATPMETGLATLEYAERAFARLESSEFSGRWGIYMNAELQRLSLGLPNSLMVNAEARYLRMDQALAYMHKIAGTFSQGMPGAFNEILPDGGCFIHAETSYGLIWPVVSSFLGFRPDAARRRVRFVPLLPEAWQNASLQEVRVGSTSMNLSVSQTGQDLQIVLETSDPTYEVVLGCLCPVDRIPSHVELNGTVIPFQQESVTGPSLEQTLPGWQVARIAPVTGQQRYELFVTR